MEITKETVKEAIAGKVKYAIECKLEDTEIRGNFATGSDAGDRKIENNILARLKRGNTWAWCCIRVVAKVDGLEIEGDDYLGGCSYKSERDFIENSQYFEDMKNEALDRLIAGILNSLSAYKELGIVA